MTLVRSGSSAVRSAHTSEYSHLTGASLLPSIGSPFGALARARTVDRSVARASDWECLIDFFIELIECASTNRLADTLHRGETVREIMRGSL